MSRMGFIILFLIKVLILRILTKNVNFWQKITFLALLDEVKPNVVINDPCHTCAEGFLDSNLT